jgi:hypothetical protein
MRELVCGCQARGNQWNAGIAQGMESLVPTIGSSQVMNVRNPHGPLLNAVGVQQHASQIAVFF